MISLLRIFAIICNNHRDNLDCDRNMIYRDFLEQAKHYSPSLKVDLYYNPGEVILVCRDGGDVVSLKSHEALEFYDSYVKPTLINIS